MTFLGKHSGTIANITVAKKFEAEENTGKTSERHSGDRQGPGGGSESISCLEDSWLCHLNPVVVGCLVTAILVKTSKECLWKVLMKAMCHTFAVDFRQVLIWVCSSSVLTSHVLITFEHLLLIRAI